LYRSVEEAERGDKTGGTGFLVWVNSKTATTWGYVYAVTNKHVIDNNFSVVRLNRKDGKTEIYNLTVYDWERHLESDVAIAQLGGLDSSVLRFKAIRTENFINKEAIEAFDIGLGDDVCMVGRFVHHGGKTYNMPSVRSGIISAMPNPNELISVGENKYEAFLVEMRSISGFSGSPTIFNFPTDWLMIEQSSNGQFKDPFRNRTPQADELNMLTWLVGIDTGNFPHYEKVFVEEWIEGKKHYKETNYKAENHSGFSVVIPAWKILDLLNLEVFAMTREENDKKLMAKITENPIRLDVHTNADIFSPDDFQDALKRASRKISEPVPEKK
jgi:hypothetical protein